MEYTIDRSKWVCGRIDELGQSMLLNEKGRMCCLGQICHYSRISKKRLNGIGSPPTLAAKIIKAGKLFPKTLNWLIDREIGMVFYKSSDVAGEMMIINDNATITQKERESKLKALAKKAGHTLKFTGRLMPVK